MKFILFLDGRCHRRAFFRGGAGAPYLFYAVSAFLGLYYAAVSIAGMMIVFEFTTPEKRPFYIGLNNTIPGIFSGIAPVTGGIIISFIGHQWLFIVSGILYCFSLLFLVLFVKDPRFKKGDNKTTVS